MAKQIWDGAEVVEVDASGNVIEVDFKKEGRGRTEVEPVYSEEFIEQCEEAGIDSRSIRDGGDYRQLVGDTQADDRIYWLDLPYLLEFELKDQATDDDDEFWQWFKDLAKEKKLQTKSQRTKKENKRWDSGWKSKWGEQSQRIGSWWSNWGYSSSGSTGSDLTKKLAIALKAVTTTVSVVNDTGSRYHVKLAQDSGESPTSYTNYAEQIICVSPQALLDTSVDQDTGIEITTGYALHEASHVKYSSALLECLTKPSELRPKSVAHLLHNLLEDLRIESLTGKKFPGFADYFVTANHYLFEATKQHAPKTWGPKLQDKLNAAIMMAKFPVDFGPWMKDPSLAAEYPWWRAWGDGYVAGNESLRFAIIRALEHLDEDEQTKEELEKLTEAEEKYEQDTGQDQGVSEEEFKQLLEELKKLLEEGGKVSDPCPSPGEGPKVTLTDEQAAELEKLISEQYQQFEAFFKMKDGNSSLSPTIEVMRPEENAYSKQDYKRPGGMAERLREVFFFRKTVATEAERLLKSGSIDEEELWRVGIGDDRVFERYTEPEEQATSVTMLIDCSGSMRGRGIGKAQDLANVMLACLRTQRGVRVRVRGHSTGALGYGEQTCQVYRIWEPGDPDTRIGLLAGVGDGSNFDGFAIDWCAKELNDTAQANEQKLLIVLSDGLPAGTISGGNIGGYAYYGGEAAMKHMRQVGDYWERQGVKTVQIAIDPDGVRPENQAMMFKHWIGYETDQKLLVDLTKLLAKTFGGVE